MKWFLGVFFIAIYSEMNSHDSNYLQNIIKIWSFLNAQCSEFLIRNLYFLLQVTSLLLEGERRKLAVLQRELQVALEEGGSVKVKEKQRQELLHAIS